MLFLLISIAWKRNIFLIFVLVFLDPLLLSLNCTDEKVIRRCNELAVQVLSETAKEIYLDPSIASEAKKELAKEVGMDFIYVPLLGDRKPPLNYRDWSTSS